MSLGPLYVFLGEVCVQVLCPFFNWIVCLPGVVMWVLYIFWTADPCLMYYWQICFPYCWFSFYFNTVFFSHAEAFYFDEVPFVYSFLYVPCSRGHISENTAAWNIWDFPAYVLLYDFMVSWLIFMSFIHLEFIFVYGVNWYSSFIFCMQLSNSPNTICWRGYFYSTLYCCPLCWKLIDRRDLGLFLGSLFCSIGLCAWFYASTRLFWLQWPCNTVCYQVLWSLLLCSSFSKLLQLFRVVYGSI